MLAVPPRSPRASPPLRVSRTAPRGSISNFLCKSSCFFAPQAVCKAVVGLSRTRAEKIPFKFDFAGIFQLRIQYRPSCKISSLFYSPRVSLPQPTHAHTYYIPLVRLLHLTRRNLPRSPTGMKKGPPKGEPRKGGRIFIPGFIPECTG